MAMDKILSEIAQIETIIERWKTTPVSNIERELVLEKLRKVYDKVIFIDDESIEMPSAEGNKQIEDLAAEDEQAISFEFNENDDDQVEPEDESSESQHEIYGLDDSEDQEDQQEAITFTVPSLEDQDQDQEEIVYFDDEDAQFDEEEDDEVENLARIKSTDLDAEIKTMFGGSNLDSDAISSLYGQDSDDLEPAESKGQEEALETPVQASETTPEETEEQPQTETQTPAPALEDQDITSTVEHIVVKPTKTLRSDIGMNDKYIMTRNMFNSDSRLFEKTINELDEMTDINEALLYINDNFSWNPDDDSVKLLISLLEDKLM